MESPNQIFSVYRRKNVLFVNNELYELNKPGFCRDSEDKEGKYQLCIREIMPHLVLSPALSLDSIYVFEKRFYNPSGDSSSTWTYISGVGNMLVKKEKRNKAGEVIGSEALFSVERK